MNEFFYLVRYHNPIQGKWHPAKQTKHEKQAYSAFRAWRERVGSPDVDALEMIRIVVGSGNDFHVIAKA